MNPRDQGFKIVVKTVGGGLRTFLRLTGIHIFICSLNAHPRARFKGVQSFMLQCRGEPRAQLSCPKNPNAPGNKERREGGSIN